MERKPSLEIRKKKLKYSPGDKVRIVREKGKFEKGYEPNFTMEIFTVRQALPRDPPVYRIQDQKGEVIQGIFYNEELVRAIPDTARPKRYR